MEQNATATQKKTVSSMSLTCSKAWKDVKSNTIKISLERHSFSIVLEVVYHMCLLLNKSNHTQDQGLIITLILKNI